MQIPNILFIRSIHTLLTRDIILKMPCLVNHFFIFSANLFSAAVSAAVKVLCSVNFFAFS